MENYMWISLAAGYGIMFYCWALTISYEQNCFERRKNRKICIAIQCVICTIVFGVAFIAIGKVVTLGLEYLL